MEDTALKCVSCGRPVVNISAARIKATQIATHRDFRHGKIDDNVPVLRHDEADS